MDQKQKRKLTFALGIILLIIGIWIDYNIENLSYPDHTPLIIAYYAFNTIPGLLFILSLILDLLNINIKKYFIRFAVYTIVAGVIINVCMAFFVHALPVTDPSHLNRALIESGYPNNKALSLFTVDIPENAEGIKFFYKRQIVKSNWALKIKYKLPNDEYEKAKYNYRLNEKKALDKTAKSAHLSPLYSDDLPDDLDILVLDTWDVTNATYGIAFSDSNHEVAYFAYVSQDK